MQISTLADRALLVRMSRSLYQPYAYDAGATRSVELSTGVTGAGRFNKRLLRDCRELDDVNTKYSQLYTHYCKETVPWLDDGVRMLPNAIYFEFAHQIRDLKAECEHSVDILVSRWDALVQADLNRLGALGNPNDYPSARELQNRYAVKVQFFPIPTTEDFRMDIDEEDKKRLAEAINEAQENVRKHLMFEMVKPLKKLVEKLAVPIGDKGSIFRDSLADNILEEVTRLRRLNINDDADVKAVLKEIEDNTLKFSGNLDVLRESPIMRETARAQMDAMVSKMSGMFSLEVA